MNKRNDWNDRGAGRRGVRYAWLAAVLVCTAALAAVARAATPAAPLSPAAAAPREPPPPALVFYFEGEKPCRWRLYDPVTAARRTLYETAACPVELLWDAAGARSVFLDARGQAFELPWTPGATARPLGKPLPEGGLLWRDPASGRLHAAYVVRLPGAELERGGQKWLRYRGKEYESFAPVTEGTPGVVVVLEADTGGWKEKAVVPTRCRIC